MDKEIVVRLATPVAELYEGFKSKPYIAPEGNWTYGFGFIYDDKGNRVTAHTPAISLPDAAAGLRKRILTAIDDILRVVKVPLTNGQLACLVDFVFNFGIGQFLSSTLLAKLNKKDYSGAKAELPRWIHIVERGKTVESDWLKKRRIADGKLWDTPDTVKET